MNTPPASRTAANPAAANAATMAVPAAAEPGPLARHRIAHALLVVVMLELGLLLLILPWSREWSGNSWAMRWPEFWKYWVNPYFRGAISGLGLLNLWFGTEEIVPHTAPTPERLPRN